MFKINNYQVYCCQSTMLKLNVLTFNKWNGKWLYINLNPSFSYQNTINSLNFFPISLRHEWNFFLQLKLNYMHTG